MKKPNKRSIILSLTDKLLKISSKLTLIKIRKIFKLKAKYLEKRRKEKCQERMFGILLPKLSRETNLTGLKINSGMKFLKRFTNSRLI
jgi:hypothetical protein